LSAGIKSIEDIVSLALVFEVRSDEYLSAIETRKESFVKALQQSTVNISENLSPSAKELSKLRRKGMTIGSSQYVRPADARLVTLQLPVHISGAPTPVLVAQIEMNRMRQRVQSQPFSNISTGHFDPASLQQRRQISCDAQCRR
jgi:hypothetical protein